MPDSPHCRRTSFSLEGMLRDHACCAACALIVADDLSNTIWRVVPDHKAPTAEAPSRPARPVPKGDQPDNQAPY